VAGRLRFVFGFALLEPEALAVHLEDMDVMGQAVEERACEAFRSKDLGPFIEGQVGGDQDRATLVALAEDSAKLIGEAVLTGDSNLTSRKSFYGIGMYGRSLAAPGASIHANISPIDNARLIRKTAYVRMIKNKTEEA